MTIKTNFSLHLLYRISLGNVYIILWKFAEFFRIYAIFSYINLSHEKWAIFYNAQLGVIAVVGSSTKGIEPGLRQSHGKSDAKYDGSSSLDGCKSVATEGFHLIHNQVVGSVINSCTWY